MKFALFNGCKIPYYLPHYATATIAVLETLGVELVDIKFNCCGYPTRNLHFDAYILSAAKNLAKAEQEGLITLNDSGIEAVLQGITTPEEIVRVLARDRQ